MRTISIIITTLSLAGGTALADGKLNVTHSGKSVTHDCGTNGEIYVAGSRNTIALRGTCAKVAVSGSGNTLTVEGVDKLAISGSRNLVDVVGSNKISVSGNENRVHYVRGLGDKPPKTQLVGKLNTVKQVDAVAAKPASSPTTGEKPADPPPAEKPKPTETPTGAKTVAKPFTCTRESLDLDNVVIETEGVAITTQGNCSLTIRNSKVVSTNAAAVQTMGSSTVTFENVEVIGKDGSIVNAGSAMVKIKGSTLRGAFVVGGSATVRLENSHVHGARNVGKSSIYIDGGGNTFHKK